MNNQVKSKVGLLALLLLSACSSMRPVGGYFPGFTEESRAEIAAAKAAEPKPRSSFIPVIDRKGINNDQWQIDLQDCQEYGAQVAGVGTGLATGAVMGAVVGGLLTRSAGFDVGSGARVGAIAGGVGGSTAGIQNEQQVVSRCLSGRGYSVLSGL